MAYRDIQLILSVRVNRSALLFGLIGYCQWRYGLWVRRPLAVPMEVAT